MRMYPPPALQSNLTFTPFILPNFLLLYQTSHRILIHPHLVFSCPAGHPRPCVLVVSLYVYLLHGNLEIQKKKKKSLGAPRRLACHYPSFRPLGVLGFPCSCLHPRQESHPAPWIQGFFFFFFGISRFPCNK